MPSGGIVYDLRVRTGLAELGWDVQWLAAPGSWPHPAPADLDAWPDVSPAPAATLVLVDGLVGSAAADVLLAEAGRLRLVHLVHLPFDNPRERSLLAAATVVTTSAWTRRWLITDYALSAVASTWPNPARTAPRWLPAARGAAGCSASAR